MYLGIEYFPSHCNNFTDFSNGQGCTDSQTVTSLPRSGRAWLEWTVNCQSTVYLLDSHRSALKRDLPVLPYYLYWGQWSTPIQVAHTSMFLSSAGLPLLAHTCRFSFLPLTTYLYSISSAFFISSPFPRQNWATTVQDCHFLFFPWIPQLRQRALYQVIRSFPLIVSPSGFSQEHPRPPI
jgi:hypothetical protein